MNTAHLDARTVSEDELNNAVNAMPFLAAQRLVLLDNLSARYNKPEARESWNSSGRSLKARGWSCLNPLNRRKPKELAEQVG